MAESRFFVVTLEGIKHRLSFDDGMYLLSQMDSNPYSLTDYEVECARLFSKHVDEINETGKKLQKN
tara:strand:+ start:353 stop:550 length:198 start_codon:yes stop_codon:yes gene_type:complete